MIDKEKLHRLKVHCDLQRNNNKNVNIREEHEFIHHLIKAYGDLEH